MTLAMVITHSVRLSSLSLSLALTSSVVTLELDMGLYLCLDWVVSALSVGLVSVAGDCLRLLYTSSAGAIG